MTDGDFIRDVREFAVAIVESADGDPVARMGIMHAATHMIAAFAIEEMDPARTIEALVGDIHAEATALVEMMLAGKVVASESNNVIPMEKLK